MENISKEKEIDDIVQKIYSSLDGTKNIDALSIYNKPDKTEVRELVNKLYRVIYPGYYRDRSVKIYNPKNTFAVTVEDVSLCYSLYFYGGGEDFCLGEGITILIKVFVLIYIYDIDIVIALAIIPVKKMSEILHIALNSVLGHDTVADIVMFLFTKNSLSLDLILNPLVVIGMNHTLKGSAGQLNEFAHVLAPVHLKFIVPGVQDALNVIGLIDKEASRKTCRNNTTNTCIVKLFSHTNTSLKKDKKKQEINKNGTLKFYD